MHPLLFSKLRTDWQTLIAGEASITAAEAGSDWLMADIKAATRLYFAPLRLVWRLILGQYALKEGPRN